jgi:Na+/H+-dicarboxylate symporter
MSSHSSRFPLHWQILVALILGTFLAIMVRPLPEVLPDVPAEIVHTNETEYIIRPLASAVEPVATSFAISYKDLKAVDYDAPKLAERIKDLPVNGQAPLTLTAPQLEFMQEKGKIRVVMRTAIEKEVITGNFLSPTEEAFEQSYPQWKLLKSHYQSQFGFHLSGYAKSIGDLFLQMLKMVTIPLIVSSLISSVTGMRDLGRLGKMLSGTLFYYFVTSALAIITGILMVNLIRPGIGLSLPIEAGSGVVGAGQSIPSVFWAMLLNLFPANPFQALVGGDFLSIISFSLIFGIFATIVGGEVTIRLNTFSDDVFQVMMRITTFIISLAPIGVFALIFASVSSQGLGLFLTLAWYMLTVFLALAFHAGVTLPCMIYFLGKRNPWTYLQNMAPALLTAFSTASSNATLPLTMNCVENRAGIKKEVASFVLPLGATVNMDGTALYEAVAVLFIGQVTLGADFALSTQIVIAITALVASVGAAGIPHAGLVMMAICLQAAGLPLEAQGLIIAVDRILDMCRTTVNVFSDMSGCSVIDRFFGSQFNDPVTESDHPISPMIITDKVQV